MSAWIRIKVTVPDKIMEGSQIYEKIKSVLRSRTAPELRTLFRETTEGWKKKPGFLQTFQFAPTRLSAQVFASGAGADIYALVNAGAPPHIIRRRRSPTLRFQEGYIPSTSPRVLNSHANSKFGRWWNVKTVKRHLGFEAREFDDTIAETYEPIFRDDIQEAINSAAAS